MQKGEKKGLGLVKGIQPEDSSASASSSFLFGSLYWPASKIKTVLCNSLDNR